LMKPFHELQASRATAELLHQELDLRGYVLLRRVLPRNVVAAVLADVTEVLDAAGWFAPGSNGLLRIPAPGAAFGDPDPAFKQTYQQVFSLESLHALPHQAALKHVMGLLVGEP